MLQNVIGDSSRHRWRNTQRFVDAPEVVPAIPEHHSGAVVLPFLAERIRQPCKATEAHSQRKVGSFHNRSANTLGIRLPHYRDNLR